MRRIGDIKGARHTVEGESVGAERLPEQGYTVSYTRMSSNTEEHYLVASWRNEDESMFISRGGLSVETLGASASGGAEAAGTNDHQSRLTSSPVMREAEMRGEELTAPSLLGAEIRGEEVN